MNYFRIAISFLRKRWLFTLIIILEIAALLVLTNVMVATVHSKQMVYEPYRNILSENGVVVRGRRTAPAYSPVFIDAVKSATGERYVRPTK